MLSEKTTRRPISKPSRTFLLVLLALLVSAASSARPQQSPDKKKQLQSKYNRLMDDIKQIENSLKETKNKKNESLSQLQSVNAKIHAREELLANIREQVDGLDKEIMAINGDVSSQSTELQELKKEYAGILLDAYRKIDRTNQWFYIFSAGSLSEAYQRYLYLKKYGEYRSSQAQRISNTITDLNVKIEDLNKVRTEKADMMNKEQEQQAVLIKEKETQKQLIAQLSKDEAKLKKEVEKKNQEARQLNNEIQRIIEKEIEEARKRAELEAKKRAEDAKRKAAQNNSNKSAGSVTPKKEVPSEAEMTMTPAEALLSRDFVSNRARLPWPVEKGYIISHFGKHLHPSADVYVENNGVDIKTSENARVRSIFEGTVISVFFMPFNQNSVIIKHGEYFTVYSSLRSVDVKPNSKVSTRQNIGTAYTNDSEGVTLVHFEIWKGKVKMDPEGWLAGG